MQYLKEHSPAFVLGALLTLVLVSLWSVNHKMNEAITKAEEAKAGVENIGNNFQQGVINVIKGLQQTPG